MSDQTQSVSEDLTGDDHLVEPTNNGPKEYDPTADETVGQDPAFIPADFGPQA